MANKETKVKTPKKDPIKTAIGKWKSMDEEKRVFIIIIVIIFFFIMVMPNIYKGWVSFRDSGYRLWPEKEKTPEVETKNPNAGKTLTMTCSQSIQDNDYKLEIKTIIYYVDSQLKRENYTATRTALSDFAKEELPIRKALFEPSEKSYQELEGFTIQSSFENDVFSYNLLTDYAKVDKDAVTFDDNNVEEGQIRLSLEYNQNIDSVKSYYENQGLKCVKEA